MKLLLIISTILLISCGTINHIESSHNHFYYDTKALIVVEKKGIKLTCKSPAGICWYQVKDYCNLFQKNDTIVLIENDWVYGNVKFLKHE
jgi:hypothetical protein